MRAARDGRGMGADVGEALVDVGDAAGIVRRFGLGEQARALLVGGEHELDQAVGSARRFLRHPADAGGAGHVDAAVVGLQLAGDQAQQRGLARAVAADEADLVPRRNARRGLVEDDAPLDAVGEVVDVQHGRKAIAEWAGDVMGLDIPRHVRRRTAYRCRALLPTCWGPRPQEESQRYADRMLRRALGDTAGGCAMLGTA